MISTFDYSQRERDLISYFGFSSIADRIAPENLYRLMAEKAFLENDQTTGAESVRRCLKAFGTIHRMTPGWDSLIELPNESVLRPDWIVELNEYQRDNLLQLLNWIGWPWSEGMEPLTLLYTGDWVGEIGEQLTGPKCERVIDENKCRINATRVYMQQRFENWVPKPQGVGR